MTNIVKDRSSNFELLRIFAMIGIIFFHYSDHGCNSINYDNALAVNTAFEYISRIGGGLGNCLFMILTGYFCSKSVFRLNRLYKVWGQVFFYSVFSYLVACELGRVFSAKEFFEVLTPITSNQYWYFTAYVIVIAFSPLLNAGFAILNKKQMLAVLLLLGYFFSVMPTLGFYTAISQNRIGVMIFLYCIGGYIRFFHSAKSKKSLVIEFFSALIVFLVLAFFMLKGKFDYVWGIEKAPIILLSVIVFLVFKNLNIANCKFINWVAASCFGVYLIHMNNYTTYFIWDNLLHTTNFYLSKYMIPYVIFSVSMIFILATLIDKVREYIEYWFISAITNFRCIQSKIVLIVCLTLTLVFSFHVYNNSVLHDIIYSNINYEGSSKVVSVQKESRLSQEIIPPKPLNLKQLEFKPITWNRQYADDSYMYVSVINNQNNERLFIQAIPLNVLKDQVKYCLNFNKDIALLPNVSYSLVIDSNVTDESKGIALMLTKESNGNTVRINDNMEEGLHLGIILRGK